MLLRKSLIAHVYQFFRFAEKTQKAQFAPASSSRNLNVWNFEEHLADQNHILVGSGVIRSLLSVIAVLTAKL